MSSVAAELSLRRRLLNRTAVFVLGALAFVAVAGRYPPLDLDGVLIFGGVLFFVTLGLAIWVERRALHHGDAEKLKRVYYGLVPLPWILSALLLGNGALDHGSRQVQQARIVGKFSMSGALPSRRLVVTSWRPGHRVERIPVDRGDFDLFSRGDEVNVTLGAGIFGIPWVVGVSRR